MNWIWGGLLLTACLLSLDWIYRRIVSSRIRSLVDNVPPFGVVDGSEDSGADVFQVTVSADLTLPAALFRPPDAMKGLILFCPEFHGTHWNASTYCQPLVRAGYGVLSFSFRDSVEECDSDHKPVHWVTETEIEDIEAVLKHIRQDAELKKLPLGVYGVSRGGSAALIAACRFPQIQALFTDSAYDTMLMVKHFVTKFSRYVVPDWLFRWLPQWHIDIVLRQGIAQSQRGRGCRYVMLKHEPKKPEVPIILVSGGRDSYVTPDVTQRLALLAGPSASVWIVPRAKHNRAQATERSEYEERLIQHFDRCLPGSGADESPESQVA